MPQPSYKNFIYAALTIMIWSTHAVYGKSLLQSGAGVFELIFYRSLGGLLLALFINKGRINWQGPISEWVPGTALFFNFIAFNAALKFINGYLVIVLEATAFMFSILIDRFFHKKKSTSVFAILFFTFGIGLLLREGLALSEKNLLIGMGLALTAAFTFAIRNAAMQLLSDEPHKVQMIFWPIFLLSIPFAFQDVISSPLNFYEVLLTIALFGIVQSGLANFFWLKAGQGISGSVLSLVFLLTIPGTFLTEWSWLGIDLSPWQVGGALCLIAAVLVHSYTGFRKTKLNFKTS